MMMIVFLTKNKPAIEISFEDFTFVRYCVSLIVGAERSMKLKSAFEQKQLISLRVTDEEYGYINDIMKIRKLEPEQMNPPVPTHLAIYTDEGLRAFQVDGFPRRLTYMDKKFKVQYVQGDRNRLIEM